MNANRPVNTFSWMGKIFLGFLFLSILTGCSRPSLENSRELPPIASNKPRVYIHPTSTDLSRATIVVPPFQIPAAITSIRGEEVAALFQQTLLRQQVFHKVKLVPNRYGTVQEAIEFGHEKDADLILTGTINHILAGSNAGGGRLSVSLRVIDLASSNTVWYMEQTVSQAINYPDNSLLGRLSRIFSPQPIPRDTPAPSIPAMLSIVSMDMSRIIKSGRHSSSYSDSL